MTKYQTRLTEEEKVFLKGAFASLGDAPNREKLKIVQGTFLKKFAKVLTRDMARNNAYHPRFAETIAELNQDTPTEKLYTVENGIYVFVREKKRYEIPVEEIDRMFFDFSKHGENLSSEEMLAKYELKPEVWHMVKNRLRLYKDSNVISPYTAENTPEAELEEIIETASARHIDGIKKKMVQTHEKLFKKEAKRTMKTLANAENFLENLQTFLESYPPKQITFEPVDSRKMTETPNITVAMSDFHFGKRGTAEISRRMRDIRDYIVMLPQKCVHILSLGDLAEAFVEGGMHPGQEAHMERTGFDLMLYIAEEFQNFLLHVRASGKTIQFIGICGNHDRFGKSHSDDQARTGGLATYEIIRLWLKNVEGIRIDYLREKTNSYYYGNVKFIINHGDDGFSNRKPEDILWKNGDPTKHNVILHGDKHNATVKETKNATMVGLPSLAGRWEYDSRLDLHSESGFVVVSENRYGSVDVMLKRL